MKNKHIHPARLGSILAVAGVMTMAGIFLSGCFNTKAPKTQSERHQAIADDMQETLEVVVEDAGKRQQMKALIDQELDALLAGTTELAELRQELSRLNKDYNATREELEDVNNQMLVIRRKHIARFIAFRQSLASLATDEEWMKLIDHDFARATLMEKKT